MHLESTKLICLAMFIIMCVPVGFLGALNEKRIAKRNKLLNGEGKIELNKENIMTLVQTSNYPYLMMICIPTFSLMGILFIVLNDLQTHKYALYAFIGIAVFAVISFFIIRLINNRHYRKVKKDKYEVRTLKLEKIREEKNKHFLVFDDVEIKVRKKHLDKYKVDEEYLIVFIGKRKKIIYPAEIYFYLH